VVFQASALSWLSVTNVVNGPKTRGRRRRVPPHAERIIETGLTGFAALWQALPGGRRVGIAGAGR
jgi:hypothetical protein